METWTVDIKNSPAQLVENLIWPNRNYKADRCIVNGLKDLAEKGKCCFLDDDEEPCMSTVTIRGSQAEVQYEKPDNRRLDYGARHLAEIVTKLMSGALSPEVASGVSVNSCMRRG